MPNRIGTEAQFGNTGGMQPQMRPTRNTITDRIRIDKWNLFFDERSGLSINDLIFRIETLQRQYKYPWEEIIRDFTIFLKGNATK